MLPPLAERQHVGAGHAVDPGQLADPAQDLVVGDRQRLVVRVGQLEARGDQLAGVEAGIDRQHLEQAARDQPGPGQQHERERHLADHERVAQPAAREIRRAPPVGAQHIGQVGPRRPQRAHHADRDSRDQRDPERDQQRGGVHLGAGQERHGAQHHRRHRRDQEIERRQREEDADRAARHRIHHRLGREQPDQLAPIGAERGAHRQLLAARQVPGEEEVGDVGARDEQDQPRRAQEQHHDRPRLAEDLLRQRDQEHAALAIGVGIGRGQPPRHRGRLGLRLLDAHTGRQPGDHVHPVEVAALAHAALRLGRNPHLGCVGRREREAG